jgi:hypothetical protein
MAHGRQQTAHNDRTMTFCNQAYGNSGAKDGDWRGAAQRHFVAETGRDAPGDAALVVTAAWFASLSGSTSFKRSSASR